MSDIANNIIPIVPPDYDGWDDIDADDRVIQGALVKCVDGHWSTKDRTTPPKQLLALATTQVIQQWQDKAPVGAPIFKRPGQPWPNIDELNATIPQEDWELGLDGKPRAPFQKQHLIYFLEPHSAAKFTYANGTTGASIAVRNLKDQIKWMRAMRGDNVVPLVELADKPFPTKYGQKLRPDFRIVEWRNLGVSLTKEAPQVGAAAAIEPPSTSEDVDDEIPF